MIWLPAKGRDFYLLYSSQSSSVDHSALPLNRFQAVKLITPLSSFEVRGQLYCTIKLPSKVEECNCTRYARFEVLIGMMKP